MEESEPFPVFVMSTNTSIPNKSIDMGSYSGGETDVAQPNNPYIGASLACGVSILAITVVGVIVNALTIKIYIRRQPPTSILILLIGLAAADGLLLICAGPLYASVALYSYATSLDPPITSPVVKLLETSMSYMAVYLYPVTSVFQTLSVWIMVLITVDRYVAVSHPFLARTTCTKQRAITALILVSVASICYNAIRAFDYALVEETSTDEVSGEVQTLLVVKHALRANQTYLTIYSHWMYFIFIFAIPFAVLLFLNGFVVAVIRKAQKCRAVLSRQRKKEHATATMMIMVTVIFLICNSLAFMVNAIESFGGNRGDGPKNESDSGHGTDLNLHQEQSTDSSPHSPFFYFLIDLSNLLVLAHCTSNFFIYLGFCKRFRQQCRSLFLAKSAKRLVFEELPLNRHGYSFSIASVRSPRKSKALEENRGFV